MVGAIESPVESIERNTDTKPRVFLGTLSVTPNMSVQQPLSRALGIWSDELEGDLKRQLAEIFSLPPVGAASDIQSDDLGLDVSLTSDPIVRVPNGPPPDTKLFMRWRPKIELTGRLYYLLSGDARESFQIVERMGWWDKLIRGFGHTLFSPTQSAFDESDQKRLIQRGSKNLLKKMVASL